jgi:hypothetical protein
MQPTIDTHIHKRLMVDYTTCVMYYPPIGDYCCIVFPSSADDGEWFINIFNHSDRELVVHDSFESLEDALNELDRRYGALESTLDNEHTY